MNRTILAAMLVALALVLFGCVGADNSGNGAAVPPANPGQISGNPPQPDNTSVGQGAAPSQDNSGQVATQTVSGPAQNGNSSMMGNNSGLLGGVDLTNVSQADADPTAGLISNENVPGAPN